MGRAKLIITALLLLPTIGASSGRGNDVTFVTDGKSDYRICIRKSPSPVEEFAAGEFARYVKQISGAELKIDRTEPRRPHRIMISTSERGPSAPGRSGFSLRPNGPDLFITGESDDATLAGVYHVLDLMGCRFLAPQLSHYVGSAEFVPGDKTLTVSIDGVARFQPALKFRKIYVEEGHSHTPENLAQIVEWMPKVGYNTLVVPADYQGNHRVMWDKFRERVTPECQKRGITIEVGGHGYQNFLNAEMEEGKLFDQHPDWFGQNAQGVRQKAKGWVFCTSNPKAVDYLIDKFVAYVKARPEIQIYDFWPPDGAKWCECDACKKLGSPSDRQANLIRKVKERVNTARPDLRLEVLAYHTSVYPPEKEKLDKDVLLDFCPISQQFDHQIDDPAADKNADYAKGLQAWRKAFDGDISIYSYYRKYAWDSLPVIIPHYMQKDLQWYAKVPVQGVSTYAEPGDWCTYELNHYVLAALAWNPDADVDAIVRKFCIARYGELADTALTTLLALQKITRNTCSIPNTALKPAHEIAADQKTLAAVIDGVNIAIARTKEPAVKRSFDRLALMCTYAAKDLEIQSLRVSNADNESIRKQATELHEFLAQHADDGVFLIKDQRISPQRMLRRYGAGGATTQRGG